MKKYLVIIACLLGFPSQAQTFTNVTLKLTVDRVTAGITNSVSSNIKLEGTGSKRDMLRVDGLVHGFKIYKDGSGDTITVFDGWLKQHLVDMIDEHSKRKQEENNRNMLNKIVEIVTKNPDLLTAGDISSLSTIAAKNP